MILHDRPKPLKQVQYVVKTFLHGLDCLISIVLVLLYFKCLSTEATIFFRMYPHIIRPRDAFSTQSVGLLAHMLWQDSHLSFVA